MLGDSLTAGYGLQPDQAIPVRLQAALKAEGRDVTVLNHGVSGDTSAGGVDRVDWMLGDKPDIGMVELGANDALRAVAPPTPEPNLDPIGRIVVLEDTDHDGVMDKRTVFADGLILARALKVLEHGVLVGEPPNLWLMHDTDGELRADKRELIFEPYYTEKGDGTGLGLAIVRQTIEQHRGTIAVTETPSGGATFVVRLPA